MKSEGIVNEENIKCKAEDIICEEGKSGCER